MIDPRPEDVGKKVIYRGMADEEETGVITGVNKLSAFVFVRYGEQTTSQATKKENLDWV